MSTNMSPACKGYLPTIIGKLPDILNSELQNICMHYSKAHINTFLKVASTTKLHAKYL